MQLAAVVKNSLPLLLAAASLSGVLPGCATLFKKEPIRITTSEKTTEKSRAYASGTEIPTVPPPASTAWPTPSAKPTVSRKAKPGEPIGPEITFFGITRADGKHVEPGSIDKDGTPTYENFVGSGFQIVVEVKKGLSGYDIARRVFAQSADDPTVRPDFEIQVDRDLGDGSKEICDRWRPKIGGIPGIKPPSWAKTRAVADAINDFSCRFEVFIESMSACSLGPNEDWEFKKEDTEVQFCMMVARAWNFPFGKTLVSARVNDRAGNPGPIKRMWISRPDVPPTPRPKPTVPPTPAGLPTR